MSRQRWAWSAMAAVLVLFGGYVGFGTYHHDAGRACSYQAAKASAKAYPDFLVGISAGELAENMPSGELDAYMAEVSALNIHMVRIDLSQAAAQPTADVCNLSWLRTVAAAARRHNVYLGGIVDNAPNWEVSSRCVQARMKQWLDCAPQGPAQVQAMARFAGAATAALKGRLLKVEIGLEPNSMPEYANDPARYAAVYRAESAAVKAVDPRVLVGPGGTAGIGLSSRAEGQSAPDWYRHLCTVGVVRAMDVANINPYTWPTTPARYDPDGNWAQIERVHQELSSCGAGHKLIDVAEMGFPTGGGLHPPVTDRYPDYQDDTPVSEADQALFWGDTFRAFDALRAVGVTGSIDVFSLRDNAAVASGSTEAHFGIEDSDGRPKPAWQVVHQYALAA